MLQARPVSNHQTLYTEQIRRKSGQQISLQQTIQQPIACHAHHEKMAKSKPLTTYRKNQLTPLR